MSRPSERSSSGESIVGGRDAASASQASFDEAIVMQERPREYFAEQSRSDSRAAHLMPSHEAAQTRLVHANATNRAKLSPPCGRAPRRRLR